MPRKKLLFFLILLIGSQKQYAQYTLNGNATRDACNEYSLTQAVNWLGGSVWNNNKIDLSQSFDFNFDIFLGNSDAGADGIAFVLQPISTSVGSAGGGLGYSGITPAVGITIDTWQNTSDGDPAYDHIAIQLNGNLDHSNTNSIAGPVTALSTSNNIEDGNWHSFRISWNAATKTLSAYVDGSFRLAGIKDFVADVFSGDPLVFWGFTGSTGGFNNLQKFKTALNPAYRFIPGQKRCINESIAFFDSTISFTPVVKMYWNFGDGSPVDSVNANPIHTYTAGGDYTVTQKVIGADGCEATNTQILTIGTKPVANFGYSDPLCTGVPVSFSDSSFATFGTINNWSWVKTGLLWSSQQNPVNSLGLGSHTIKLVAGTDAGCISDTVSKTFVVQPGPDVNFNFNDNCTNTAIGFSANDVSGNVTTWAWTFGDGGVSSTKDTIYKYSIAGIFPVQLKATAANGCNTTLQKDIIIYGTQAFAGNDISVASGQPVQLQASGGDSYEWSPATGLSDPFIADPIAVLNGAQTITYTVRAYTARGCESFDDITIQVFQAPEIYLPGAFTPDGSGLNDVYRAGLAGIRDFKYLKIFNRYGQVVFSTTDPTKGWDGTYKGKNQNSGVYVVVASGIDHRGLLIERQATVMLIR
ncbi:MAG: PKD domain-containing protein [Ferruginibacter sp.]